MIYIMEYQKYRLGIELNAGNLENPVLYVLEHDGKTIVVSFKPMVIL